MQAAGLDRGLEPALVGDDFGFFSGECEVAAAFHNPFVAAAAAHRDAVAAAAAPGAATFTTVLAAAKRIRLGERCWGSGLEEEDSAPEKTARVPEPVPSNDDDWDKELAPEDLEEFVLSALSPEALDNGKPDIENATGAKGDEGVVSAKPGLDRGQQSHSQSQTGVSSSERIKGKAAAVEPKLSADALVLQELETVVSKLESRSRLCLRDAFYRLADNATRRTGVQADAAELQRLSWRTASLSLRQELSTNTIDRSVASMLFCKESPPPPLPLPAPSSPPPLPPLPPRPRSSPGRPPRPKSSASSSSSIPKKQHQHHQTPLGNNTNKKLSLAPAHKHRCAGSTSVLRTATTLRATPAAIPGAAARNTKSLILLPPPAATKRRSPNATTTFTSTSTTTTTNKRGKL